MADTTEMVFVFKRGRTRSGDTYSAFSKVLSKFPDHINANDDDFILASMYQEEVIVCCEKSLYDYKLKEDKWVELQYIDCDKTWRGAQGCAMQDFVLICGGRGLRRQAQILQLNITNHYGHTNDVVTNKMRKTSNLLLLQNEKQQTNIQTVPSQLPVCVDYGHTVTCVENKRVLVMGGFVNGNASNRVIQGEVTKNKNDVKWIEIGPMQKKRCNHIAFKMKGNVYVAGGLSMGSTYTTLSCCERLDLNTNKWFSCEYSLPRPLYDASVVVNSDESCAVITGGFSQGWEVSNGIIIFTESGGFSCLTRSTLMSKLNNHTSVLIW